MQRFEEPAILRAYGQRCLSTGLTELGALAFDRYAALTEEPGAVLRAGEVWLTNGHYGNALSRAQQVIGMDCPQTRA